MPNLISGPYRFIESGDGPVHLEFFSSPGWTLCGFEFAQDGSAVAPPGRIRFGRAPYRETARRVVNCPGCVEIVRICKAIEVEDLPELQQPVSPERRRRWP